MMIRVRKLNRRPASGAHNVRRPRLVDFQLACKRVQRRGVNWPPRLSIVLDALNKAVHAPRGTQTLLRAMRSGGVFGILVPVSHNEFSPSISELLRIVTAMNLTGVLEEHRTGPCVVALWPALAPELEATPRYVLQRDGQAHALPARFASEEEARAALVAALPHTEFTDWLVGVVIECWDKDPLIWKLRLIFRLVTTRRALALMPLASSAPVLREGMPKTVYRMLLSRTIEVFPIVGLVFSPEGPTLPIDLTAGGAFAGDVAPFPAPSATLVEHKVERWLDKYSVQPEELLRGDAHVPRMLANLLPADSRASVNRTREEVLGRVFRLEHQLDEMGYAPGGRFDKLAARLDGQFDKLKGRLADVERHERETALAQLTKAREYLRPAGETQTGAMSMLHYLNFYGPAFVSSLADAIEIGDGRHHLLYVGN